MSTPEIEKLAKTLDELEARLAWAQMIDAEEKVIQALEDKIWLTEGKYDRALRELYG